MSNFEQVSDDQLAFLLADLIRGSADLLLRGEQELTLNTDWLGFLAKKFPDFDRAETFTPATFSFTDVEHEPLAFLFEIFQIVPCVTLVPGNNYELTTGERYDLSLFRGLTSLRLVRVEASRILGIHRLRAQLQRVQCRRALTSLAYLFCECAADRTEVEMPWSALEVVNCTSNSIRELDRSLGLFPHVLELNFSDNGISELSPKIRSLRGLQKLNLGHNQITSLRALLGTEPQPYLTKLTTLTLTTNKIRSLLGLERLTSLCRLDISQNEISSFDEIRRIRHITTLCKIDIEGNPLCLERHYRARLLALLGDWMAIELDGRKGGTLEEHMLVEHYAEVAGAGPLPQTVGQPQIILKTPPKWKCDTRCFKCGTAFTWALGKTPRHHCRQCGSSVCHNHSQNSLLLPHFGDEYAGPERVCDTCYISLLQAVEPVKRGASNRKASKVLNPAEEGIQTTAPEGDSDAISFPTAATPQGRSSRQRRPKSAEIAEVNSSLDTTMDTSVSVTPKKKDKDKRKKRGGTPRKKNALNESILSEQDSLLEQVDQIFEAGGDKALEILNQAWVDRPNPDSQPSVLAELATANSTIADEHEENTVLPVVEEDASVLAPIAESGAPDLRSECANGSEPGDETNQPQESSTPVVTPVLPRKATLKSLEVPENQLLPLSPPVTEPVPRILNNVDDEVVASADLSKPAESCDEFFVTLVDGSNRSVDRIIQIQGSSSILIIDFITGKTVDMVDLSCLVDIQQGVETPLLVRLSFIYGRKDRRVLKFILEDSGTLREFLELLEPVTTKNKTGRLNETVSALFKCLRCDAVFPYEEQRFEGPSVACQECRSNEVVEFFVHAPDEKKDNHERANGDEKDDAATASSPDRPPEAMLYSFIADDEEFNCRNIDHNRKLLLDLEHFEDNERCLGGIECFMFTSATGLVSAFVVASTKAVYALILGVDDKLPLARRIAFRDIQHVSIAVNSVRIRLGLRGREHIDLVVGDEMKAWDFVQLLADTPALSDCILRVDAAFSDAISRELPDALVQGSEELGCLQEVVSRVSRVTELRQKVALISIVEGNPVVLCTIAQSKAENDVPCVLIALGTELHVFRLYPDDPAMYVTGGGFVGSRIIDVTEIEKLQYSESTPHVIRVVRWSEGHSSPQDDSDDFTMASKRVLLNFVEQLDSLWKPNFGFDLPLEKLKRL